MDPWREQRHSYWYQGRVCRDHRESTYPARFRRLYNDLRDLLDRKIRLQEIQFRIYCNRRSAPNQECRFHSFADRPNIHLPWTTPDHWHAIAEYLERVVRAVELHMPENFCGLCRLDSFLHKDEIGAEAEEEKSKKVIEALHKILRPFLLRRVKSNVEKNLLPSTLWSCYHMWHCWLVGVGCVEKEINSRLDGDAAEMVSVSVGERYWCC